MATGNWTLLLLLVGAASAGLPARPALELLPAGSVTPRGWLLRQLVIQAEGLSGHLTKFWPKVKNSAWFGGEQPDYGPSCGAAPCPFNLTQSSLLHQEAGYWLNGFIPLAYLLRNAGITQLPPHGPGLPSIRPLDQAAAYVQHVLDHNGTSPCGAAPPCADPPAGWLGPYDIGLAGGMYWGSFPMLLALRQYAEAEPAQFNRTTLAMVNHLLAMSKQMKSGPTFCQLCPGELPCWGPSLRLPSNGSCEFGVRLCGGSISHLQLPANASPRACAEQCRVHNSHQPRQRCEAFVFARGNASRFPDGAATCDLKAAPGAYLPRGSCGNQSFDNSTLHNYCSAVMPPPDTCYNMSSVPRGSATGSISFQRWIDLAYSIIWLLDTPGATHDHESELQSMLYEVRRQGQDWDTHFKGELGGTHNVDLAQGLKSAAVNFRYSNGTSQAQQLYTQLSRDRMRNLDSNFGLPTGMYVGDEHLPPTSDRNPGRGIETCGVVEAMFSYSTMFATHGDVRFIDRAEKIALNALPATWASPRGGDMWAHQYFQGVNEINAIPIPGFHGVPSPVYTYGINQYPCCTANFHQGWPKFANAAVMTNETRGLEGIVVALYLPASAMTKYGVVSVETEYPFGDDATITVNASSATNLYLRIPGWATRAQVSGPGGGSYPYGATRNGSVTRLCLPKGVSVSRIKFNAEIRIEEDGHTRDSAASYSVHRGALLYSLPLGLNYTMTRHYYAESNDYSVVATSPWAYALDENSLEYVHDGYTHGLAPFNKTAHPDSFEKGFWPTHISATARDISHLWSLDTAKWLPKPPPASPVCKKSAHGSVSGACGPAVNVTLVPHGGTALRIGTFPLSGVV